MYTGYEVAYQSESRGVLDDALGALEQRIHERFMHTDMHAYIQALT